MSGYVPNLTAEEAEEGELRTRLANAGVEVGDWAPYPSGHLFCVECLCTFVPDFYNGWCSRYECSTANPGAHDCACHDVELPAPNEST